MIATEIDWPGCGGKIIKPLENDEKFLSTFNKYLHLHSWMY